MYSEEQINLYTEEEINNKIKENKKLLNFYVNKMIQSLIELKDLLNETDLDKLTIDNFDSKRNKMYHKMYKILNRVFTIESAKNSFLSLRRHNNKLLERNE